MDRGIAIKGWKNGMDNIHTAVELATDLEGQVTIDILRDAVNVDVLDTGIIRRRKGQTKVLSGDIHSAWAHGPYLYAVKDGDLVAIAKDYSLTTIQASVGNSRMQFVEVNGEVYYSNGSVSGKIVLNQRRNWGVVVPSKAPTITQASGGLFVGTYRVACSYVNLYGEEGGASIAAAYTLNSLAGLTITTPTTSDAEVQKCRVYLTPPNGEAFYQVAEVSPGASVIIASPPEYTVAMSTQFMTQLPPGSFIDYYRGRMYVANGNILWYSQPYVYGLTNPLSNYIAFPSEITLLKAVQGGIYLATDRTYFLSGSGGEDLAQLEILPFGAAKYSASDLPNSKDILWYTERGIMQGSDSGQVTNLQDGRVRPDPAETGSTLVRETDSIVQVIGIGVDSPYKAGLAASDYWDAEIERRI